MGTEDIDVGRIQKNFNVPDQQCSLQDIVGFMNATQSFMDDTEWVERYSWFGAMEDLSGVNQAGFLPSDLPCHDTEFS